MSEAPTSVLRTTSSAALEGSPDSPEGNLKSSQHDNDTHNCREDATVATTSTNQSSEHSVPRPPTPFQHSSSDLSQSEQAKRLESVAQAARWRQLWSDKLLKHHSSARQTREAQQLLHFYEQAITAPSSTPNASPKFHFILVAGPAGSGHSDLPKMVLQPALQAKGGYFITGKFDTVRQSDEKFKRPIPYEGYLQAFDELSQLIVQNGEDAVAHWRDVLHARLSVAELRDLSSKIPALEHALKQDGESRLGAQQNQNATSLPPDHKASKTAEGASKKFIFAFHKLVRAIGSLGYPIVMQLDNFQDADKCSVDVFTSLAVDGQESSGLVIIGTAEYDMTAPAESLQSCKDDYLKAKWMEVEEGCGGQVPAISSDRLEPTEISAFLKDAFCLESGEAEPFANMVIDQVGGNRRYLLEFLEWLYTSGHLRLEESAENTEWEWDEVVNTKVAGLSHHSFLAHKLEHLTQQEKEVLKVSSCLGCSFEHTHVAHVLGYKIQPYLDSLIHQGILESNSIRTQLCHFVHNGLQRAAYNLIPDSEKELFHLEVGRRLWRKLDHAEVERHLFLFLSQMYVGRSRIGREKEQIAVATLCLHAGQKAAYSSAFRIALVYLNFGIEMLPSRSWRDEYGLSLALFNCAAEMEGFASNFENLEAKVEKVIQNGRQLDDKILAYTTKMSGLSMQNDFGNCVKVGLEVLKMLGLPYSRRAAKVQLLWEIRAVKRLLKGKSDEQILRMPYITDEKLLCTQAMLGCLFTPSLVESSHLTNFIIVKCLKITLQHGLSTAAPFSFCAYGMLTNELGNPEEGARYGRLGLKVMEQLQALELLPRVYCLYYGILHSSSQPLKETLAPLLYARKVALQIGDIQFAGMCGNAYGWHSVECGLPLENIAREWSKFGAVFHNTRHEALLRISKVSIQFAHHAMGWTSDPLATKGDLLDYDEFQSEAKERNDIWGATDVAFCRMKLGYLFGDFELAEKHCVVARDVDNVPQGVERVALAFYIGLISLECVKRGKNIRSNLRAVLQLLRKMKKWAEDSPQSFSEYALLLEAEVASFQGNDKTARQSYLYGIAMAKESGNFYMTGLTNECYAKHLMNLGRSQDARVIFCDALKGYEAWQGHAKVRSLRKVVCEIYGDDEEL